MPYVLASQEALGQRINPDLQKQVDDGTIDEAAARELTRTRHRAAQAEARLQDANTAATTSQQAQHVTQIRQAVDQWEMSIRQRDPDYAQMSDAVRRYAQGYLQERGSPRTPQEAVALSQAAYDEVKATFARVQPAPRPTRPSPSSIHVATGTNSAEPRSMKEAVVMALANSRRA
jgi:DNA-binding NarL/FixJ family response regulator